LQKHFFPKLVRCSLCSTAVYSCSQGTTASSR